MGPGCWWLLWSLVNTDSTCADCNWTRTHPYRTDCSLFSVYRTVGWVQVGL